MNGRGDRNWEPTTGDFRSWVLSSKHEDGSPGVVAKMERLPSGSWQWEVYAAADRGPSRGDSPTRVAAQIAVETLIAPEITPRHAANELFPSQSSTAGHGYVGLDEVEELQTQEQLQPLFAARPVEADTQILRENYIKVEGIPVLHEAWTCDGVRACSLIVPKKYLPSLREEDVLSVLRQQFDVTDDYTYSNSADSHFVFVNYDFGLWD